MKKIKKQAMSLLLTLVMLVSVVSPAFAVDSQAVSSGADVRPGLELDVSGITTGETFVFNLVVQNLGDADTGVAANFESTSLIALDQTSHKIGTVAAGEEVIKEYSAVMNTAGDSFFSKMWQDLIGRFLSFSYWLRSLFNSRMTYTVVTVDGVRSAIAVELVEGDYEPDAEKYEVSFELNYIGAESIPSQKVIAGECAERPNMPVREGYSFVGWYADEECTEEYDFSEAVESDMILYAYWVEGADTVVSREQWISALVDSIDQEVETFSWYSFDDSEDAEYKDAIEVAINCGWVDLVPDMDNMVYFKPNDGATKEFVAYTAVRALLYDVSAVDVPSWTDISQVTYSAEAAQAVKCGLLSVDNNKFNPSKEMTLTEVYRVLRKVEFILASTEVGDGSKNYVNYVDGVDEVEISYTLNEEAEKVYIAESSNASDWQVGDIYVLEDASGSQEPVAIKVENITTENGKTVVEYDEPELSEVVTDFNVEGSTQSGGNFVLAEGITVVESGPVANRATAQDTWDLWGATTVEINVGKIHGSATLDMQSIEYRFVASPSWHLISIDEAYVAVNCGVAVTAGLNVDGGVNEKIKIADINCPIGWGFFISGELYLQVSADGVFELAFEASAKAGIQYTKGTGMRTIKTITSELAPKAFQASFEVGPSVALVAEFLGIKLITVGAEVGIGAEAEISNLKVSPFQICVDGTVYLYLTIYGQIGWDELNLRLNQEIFNSDNSILKKNLHIEETGIVPECTRGYGNYKGSVVRADDNRIPVNNAKIEIFRGQLLMDSTITDSHGNFVGTQLPSGSYRIRVSCSGYVPYERNFDIIGGDTTVLATQLMISRENEDEDGWDSRKCSGYVTNAYTGGKVSGATVEIKTQHLFGDDDIIDVVTTNSNGYFEFSVSIGQYEITVRKDGFITNTISVTVFNDVTNANVMLNPESAVVLDGNLRAVLKWGKYPLDLDSHMTGPRGNGRFHVYFSSMYSTYVDLDVDDTTSYGPETITVRQSEPGIYSYYVHDYSNKGSYSSTAMSNSGATVQLYSGNTLLYTINIPTNVGGTVWHVFDYDSETGKITLINDFSYNSSAGSVGS